jgi:hypothetical protein
MGGYRGRSRIKIVSDGTAHGTTITDTESGADLSRVVRAVEFKVGVGRTAEVTLHLAPQCVDVELVGSLVAAAQEPVEAASDPVAGN